MDDSILTKEADCGCTFYAVLPIRVNSTAIVLNWLLKFNQMAWKQNCFIWSWEYCCAVIYVSYIVSQMSYGGFSNSDKPDGRKHFSMNEPWQL